MRLGYITFSSEEQQFVHNVIQQITQGAIDELGLGRIRDVFSDEMFPGMSTLHRKSKYFILLPTLYSQLAQSNIKKREEIPSLIRQWEIKLTISLMNGSKNTENQGITGGSLSKKELRNGKYVKITPTSIYLSSLKYYGLVNDSMGLTDLIYQQYLSNKSVHKVRRTDQNKEDLDNDDIFETINNFVSFRGYKLNEESEIDMNLTEDEAKILKDCILNKCYYPDNRIKLYGYFLKNPKEKIVNNFFSMKEIIDNFPSKYDYLKKTYDFACDFSKWAHLMNSYYRLAFYKKINDEKEITNIKGHIENILANKDYPSKERMSEILEYIKKNKEFNDSNNLCEFCKKACTLLGDKQKEDELIELIGKREKKIKGNHYKIGNRKYKKTTFSGIPNYYSYRWNEIVYSMINDIRHPKK